MPRTQNTAAASDSLSDIWSGQAFNWLIFSIVLGIALAILVWSFKN